jgi:hypothetical protein
MHKNIDLIKLCFYGLNNYPEYESWTFYTLLC